jgi:hypothetical protein
MNLADEAAKAIVRGAGYQITRRLPVPALVAIIVLALLFGILTR